MSKALDYYRLEDIRKKREAREHDRLEQEIAQQDTTPIDEELTKLVQEEYPFCAGVRCRGGIWETALDTSEGLQWYGIHILPIKAEKLLRNEIAKKRERVKMTDVDTQDKCNQIIGLLQCLQWVVDTKDFQLYVHQPHHHLIQTIQEMIKEIRDAEEEV